MTQKDGIPAGEKGQITIPKRLRERLGLRPGTVIDYSATGRAAATSAGRAWRAYRPAGGPRERLVPDFLVAAQAVHHADR